MHNLAAMESVTNSVSRVTDGIVVGVTSIGATCLFVWVSSIFIEHRCLFTLQSDGARTRIDQRWTLDNIDIHGNISRSRYCHVPDNLHNLCLGATPIEALMAQLVRAQVSYFV